MAIWEAPSLPHEWWEWDILGSGPSGRNSWSLDRLYPWPNPRLTAPPAQRLGTVAAAQLPLSYPQSPSIASSCTQAVSLLHTSQTHQSLLHGEFSPASTSDQVELVMANSDHDQLVERKGNHWIWVLFLLSLHITMKTSQLACFSVETEQFRTQRARIVVTGPQTHLAQQK